MWRRLGDANMAHRLRNTARQIAKGPGAPNPAPPPAPHLEFAPPAAHPLAQRVLFLTPPRPHYGLDVLYDGLHTLLGAAGVVEYPYKPFLHGEVREDLKHYPCAFNHPGAEHSLGEIAALLEEGRFDLVLFGDAENELDGEVVHTLAAAAGNVPVCLIDAGDDPCDKREVMQARLGKAALGYFKREMLACRDYGPQARPLPFAYPDARVPGALEAPRPHDIFWAGHRYAGLRRPYLERLEAHLGLAFPPQLAPEDYVRQLLSSKIGLSFFGFGFDTVRYWELPAHGCMLLAERLPIAIPHNFVDGVHAVFFDDLHDLQQKAIHYLDHPQAAQAIALAGHAHFKQHHTASARARQFLQSAAGLARIA